MVRTPRVALMTLAVIGVGAALAPAVNAGIGSALARINYVSFVPEATARANGSAVRVELSYKCSVFADELGVGGALPADLRASSLTVSVRQSHTQYQGVTTGSRTVKNDYIACDGEDHTNATTVLADGSPAFTDGPLSVVVRMKVCSVTACAFSENGGSVVVSGSTYDIGDAAAPRAVKSRAKKSSTRSAKLRSKTSGK